MQTYNKIIFTDKGLEYKKQVKGVYHSYTPRKIENSSHHLTESYMFPSPNFKMSKNIHTQSQDSILVLKDQLLKDIDQPSQFMQRTAFNLTKNIVSKMSKSTKTLSNRSKQTSMHSQIHNLISPKAMSDSSLKESLFLFDSNIHKKQLNLAETKIDKLYTVHRDFNISHNKILHKISKQVEQRHDDITKSIYQNLDQLQQINKDGDEILQRLTKESNFLERQKMRNYNFYKDKYGAKRKYHLPELPKRFQTDKNIQFKIKQIKSNKTIEEGEL